MISSTTGTETEIWLQQFEPNHENKHLLVIAQWNFKAIEPYTRVLGTTDTTHIHHNISLVAKGLKSFGFGFKPYLMQIWDPATHLAQNLSLHN